MWCPFGKLLKYILVDANGPKEGRWKICKDDFRAGHWECSNSILHAFQYKSGLSKWHCWPAEMINILWNWGAVFLKDVPVCMKTCFQFSLSCTILHQLGGCWPSYKPGKPRHRSANPNPMEYGCGDTNEKQWAQVIRAVALVVVLVVCWSPAKAERLSLAMR